MSRDSTAYGADDMIVRCSCRYFPCLYLHTGGEMEASMMSRSSTGEEFEEMLRGMLRFDRNSVVAIRMKIELQLNRKM